MVEIARYGGRADAEMARALLAAAGIPCILCPGDRPGALTADASGGALLLVAEADADDALDILGRREPV
jgi:hypothetical protein